MIAMKKRIILMITAVLLLGGCAKTEVPEETEDLTPVSGDAYTLFTEDAQNAKKADSWTAGVRCEYRYKFSDDTLSIYAMDGVMEAEQVSTDPRGHITQNIIANGMNSVMEGYFLDDVLYNTYNNITYRESMSFNELKQTMLMPLDAYAYPQQVIETITAAENEDGNHVYTLILTQKSSEDIFADRFDFNETDQMDDFAISGNKIIVSFDKDGYYLGEKTRFDVSFTYSSSPIDVTFTSEVSYLRNDETAIDVTDEMEKEFAAYVEFKDIDTSTISPESTYDDSPEETVSATFRKRLINRLGYEETDMPNEVWMQYNTNEAYTVNFENKTFTYSSYSINYTYSWQGDLISMGSCSYDFKKDYVSSECQESTVEKMKEVKNYLLMELYYCGLSLEDLQNETK